MASVWLKKIKVKTRIRLIFYALMVLFALNALGLFQTLVGLGSSGITFTFELSLALVFGLFLYLLYESNKLAGKLEGRVTVATVGLEANIKSLKKTVEEKASEMGGRIVGLEGMVTKIAKTQGMMPSIEKGLVRIEGRVSRIAKTQGRLSKIERSVTNIEGRVSKIAKMQGRSSTTIRRRRARIPKRRETQEVSSGDISRAEGGAQETASQ